MTPSHVRWTGTILALAVVLLLDCRQAVPEKTSPTAEMRSNASDEPRASEISDIDIGAPVEQSAAPASAGGPPRPDWEIASEVERKRIQRQRRTRAQADWQVALRTDTPTIVPCQPLYVTVTLTNSTDQERQLDELLKRSKIWMLAGRSGEQPRVVNTSGMEDMIVCGQDADKKKTVVSGNSSVFFDRMLTIENVDGNHYNNPTPPRILSEPGDYEVYAAVVDEFIGPGPFEVLRSEPLAVTVREPTEEEAQYVEFFREGRQIPPFYGFRKVDEEAFAKVRGQGLRTLAFRRKIDVETIDKLREMLAKQPNPPVADDMRHYLMVKLIGAAKRRDEQGHDIGLDRDMLAAAAQQYLDINPNRKQLRRRGVERWHSLSSNFHVDTARPIFDILASWNASSPFYEDEVQSQAALDQIIDKIEAPLLQEARQKAAAPPSKPKLPTD